MEDVEPMLEFHFALLVLLLTNSSSDQQKQFNDSHTGEKTSMFTAVFLNGSST